MKVRSVTYFYSASSFDDALAGMRRAAEVVPKAKEQLINAGFEVQTVRVATNSFEEYLCGSASDMLAKIQQLESAAADSIDFISLGPVHSRLDVMEAALSGNSTKKSFFVLPIGQNASKIPNHETALNVAKVICRLGQSSPAKSSAVPALFRTTVVANLGAGAPYFPGGYWEDGKGPALALALEDSGLMVKAFTGQKSLDMAQSELEKVFSDAVVPLEKAANQAAQAIGTTYIGIDCSIASSAESSESMVTAYESLGLGKVGGVGTLSISAMITAVLKRLPVTRCGYSGLMFPVTEDAGLANRTSEGWLSVQQLLFYSAVCGTGIDTVPVEGSTTPDRLAMVYMDMASLAFRLNKPLSARLWPVAGKKAGDLTEVNNPFFVNAKVLSVDPVTPPVLSAKPTAMAQTSAGIGGEVTVMSESLEAIVVKAHEGVMGVALVLKNDGPEAWPYDVCFQPLDANIDDQCIDVPPASPGECVTIAVSFGGSFHCTQYRLYSSGEGFGPILIVVR